MDSLISPTLEIDATDKQPHDLHPSSRVRLRLDQHRAVSRDLLKTTAAHAPTKILRHAASIYHAKISSPYSSRPSTLSSPTKGSASSSTSVPTSTLSSPKSAANNRFVEACEEKGGKRVQTCNRPFSAPRVQRRMVDAEAVVDGEIFSKHAFQSLSITRPHSASIQRTDQPRSLDMRIQARVMRSPELSVENSSAGMQMSQHVLQGEIGSKDLCKADDLVHQEDVGICQKTETLKQSLGEIQYITGEQQKGYTGHQGLSVEESIGEDDIYDYRDSRDDAPSKSSLDITAQRARSEDRQKNSVNEFGWSHQKSESENFEPPIETQNPEMEQTKLLKRERPKSAPLTTQSKSKESPFRLYLQPSYSRTDSSQTCRPSTASSSRKPTQNPKSPGQPETIHRTTSPSYDRPLTDAANDWWREFINQKREEREKLLWKAYCPQATETVLSRQRRAHTSKSRDDTQQKKAPTVDYAKRYLLMLQKIAQEFKEKQIEKENERIAEIEQRNRLKSKVSSLFMQIHSEQVSASPAIVHAQRPTQIDSPPKKQLSSEERQKINESILKRQAEHIQGILAQRKEEQDRLLQTEQKRQKSIVKMREVAANSILISGRRDSDSDFSERTGLRSQTEDSVIKRRSLAIANCKIFHVQQGYEEIRSELLSRGWIENKDSKTAIFDFLWTVYSTSIDFRQLEKHQIVNHFEGSEALTTKLGLAKSLRQLPWLESQDISQFYPRCYDLSDKAELHAFKDDYHYTLAESLLKKFVEADGCVEKVVTFDHEVPEKIVTHKKASKLPLYVIHLALRACRFRLRLIELEGSIIDDLSPFDLCHGVLPLSQQDWDVLCTLVVSRFSISTAMCQSLFRCIDETASLVKVTSDLPKDAFDFSEKDDEKNMYALSNYVLQQLSAKTKQFSMNGSRGIWIIKPSGSSKGCGIKCAQDIRVILQGKNENARVVQKYLERPFLVNRHKVDFRQWVLVTSWDPLVIWFYHDCVLRFASEPYDPDEFQNRFIHLCNYSVQKHSGAGGSDSCPLAWTSQQFLSHLSESGRDSRLWFSKTRPEMKDIVIWAFRCSQDFVKHRQNSFALYGVDFLMDENWCPWLLEVNSSPGLRACPELSKQMLRDIVKVVIDLPKSGAMVELSHRPRWEREMDCDIQANQTAPHDGNTSISGGWELIFQDENQPEMNMTSNFDIQIEGRKVDLGRPRKKIANSK
eukprot:TRINITY_DN5022_c0_g1_i8.p1 TRINITY_DN5022_c0_g1~~TRINITY_DN5022_c0_g1_i8.p1  ORF type:complete len:1202 (+),score=204.25 TRINITY_DN5022_c0_g1_i8:72-3677(+)